MQCVPAGARKARGNGANDVQLSRADARRLLAATGARQTPQGASAGVRCGGRVAGVESQCRVGLLPAQGIGRPQRHVGDQWRTCRGKARADGAGFSVERRFGSGGGVVGAALTWRGGRGRRLRTAVQQYLPARVGAGVVAPPAFLQRRPAQPQRQQRGHEQRPPSAGKLAQQSGGRRRGHDAAGDKPLRRSYAG